MKKRTFDGHSLDVTTYSFGTEDIHVYNEQLNKLEVVRRVIYKDNKTGDLLVNYGSGLRYVEYKTIGYVCIVDENTLPINPIPLQRAY